MRLKAYLKKLVIRKQILYAMMMISVLSSLVLGIVAFNVSKYIIARNYREAYEYNLEVSSNILDIQLEGIVDSIRNTLLDERIMDVLKDAPKSYEGNMFNSEDDKMLTRALRELAGQHDTIEGVSVISIDGKMKFYYKSANSGSFDIYYQHVNLLRQPWVELTDNAKGKEVFSSKDVLLGSSYPYFSITKKLYEPFTEEFVGYMVVSIRERVFEKAFGKGVDRYVSASSMIIDPFGEKNLVYFNGLQDQKNSIEEAYLSKTYKYDKYVYSTCINEMTGWELVNAINKIELNKDSNYIAMFIGISMLLMFAISISIATKISVQIHHPLSQLESLIKEVGDGSRDIQVEFDESEVGLIGQKFKGMVNNNLELHERLLNAQIHEKEAELLLLQAQINPHFLYNTLDSLYCMAVIEDNEKIAIMVESLAKIFKLSLNQGKTVIRVSDEIQHIKEYMAIQNFRFNNRFELEISVEPSVMSCYMIKLILQPFVENAIQHGLEKKIGRGYVHVSGKNIDNECIQFIIQDNGVGLDVNQLDKGFGIKNVKERINICYGENYGVEIESKQNEGTKVIIKIPYELEPRGEVYYDSTGSI